MAIQIRRGTDAEWEVNNSNIVAGEPAVTLDSGRFFVGTGTGEFIELQKKGDGNALTDDVKQALLQIASKVAYIDENGQDYYDALESALYPDTSLVSISAVYTQSGTVYDSDSLDSLKADLVVTAHYDDSSTEVVTAYTLSGTLEVGTSTITVAYGGKTTTFDVTVTDILYSIENVAVATGDQISTGVNFLKADFNGTFLLDYSITSLPTSGNGSTIGIIGEYSQELNNWAIRIGKASGSNTALNGRWMGSSNESMGFDALSANTRHRFAITHEANSPTIVVRHKKGTGTIKTWTKTAGSFTATSENTIGLGAQINGASSLCAGTVNSCTIYDRILSQEELNTFFG